MLNLSNFLDIGENVEFFINNSKFLFKIENNLLKFQDRKGRWKEHKMTINEIVNAKFTFPPKTILEQDEKDLLKKAISLYSDKVDRIYKLYFLEPKYPGCEYISITYTDRPGMTLPMFKKGEKFKRLEIGVPYTVEDLGLKDYRPDRRP